MEGEVAAQKELAINSHSVSQGKVMFMEEVDYKMEEVHETENDSKKVLLKNEQFS